MRRSFNARDGIEGYNQGEYVGVPSLRGCGTISEWEKALFYRSPCTLQQAIREYILLISK